MKNKKLIYIVDDDRFSLLLISRMLKKDLDCKTKLFRSGEAILAAVEREIPDLILSDYKLSANGKSMDGDQLMSILRNRLPNCSVVMYSALNREGLAIRLMQKGANDFVYNDDRFLECLSSSVKREFIKEKAKRKEHEMKLIVWLTLFLIVGMLVYLHYTNQEWLLNFSLLILLIFLSLTILFKPKSQIN